MKVVHFLSNKRKRILAVTGCSIACVILIAAIVPRFYTSAQAKNVSSSSKPVSSSESTVNSSTSNKAVTVQATTHSVSSVSAPTKTDQSTQDLQSKVTKPAMPSESEIKNPSKPPSSSAGSKPSGSGSAPSQSANARDKQNGKVYVPGFGWMANNGGGGSGSTVGQSGDQLTGNKVGQMN